MIISTGRECEKYQNNVFMKKLFYVFSISRQTRNERNNSTFLINNYNTLLDIFFKFLSIF